MALTPKKVLGAAKAYTDASIEGTTGPLHGKSAFEIWQEQNPGKGMAEFLEYISGKPPRINAQGNWETWDNAAQAYVDTGEKAQGEPGGGGVITQPAYTDEPIATAFTFGNVAIGDGLIFTKDSTMKFNDVTKIFEITDVTGASMFKGTGTRIEILYLGNVEAVITANGGTYQLLGYMAFDYSCFVSGDISAITFSQPASTIKINDLMFSLVDDIQSRTDAEGMNYARQFTYSHDDIYPQGENPNRITWLKIVEISADPNIANQGFSLLVSGLRDGRSLADSEFAQEPNSFLINGSNTGGYEGIGILRLGRKLHEVQFYSVYSPEKQTFTLWAGGMSNIAVTAITILAGAGNIVFGKDVRYNSLGDRDENIWPDCPEGEWNLLEVGNWAVGLWWEHIPHDIWWTKDGKMLTYEEDGSVKEIANVPSTITGAGIQKELTGGTYDRHPLFWNDDNIYTIGGGSLEPFMYVYDLHNQDLPHTTAIGHFNQRVMCLGLDDGTVSIYDTYIGEDPSSITKSVVSPDGAPVTFLQEIEFNIGETATWPEVGALIAVAGGKTYICAQYVDKWPDPTPQWKLLFDGIVYGSFYLNHNGYLVTDKGLYKIWADTYQAQNITTQLVSNSFEFGANPHYSGTRDVSMPFIWSENGILAFNAATSAWVRVVPKDEGGVEYDHVKAAVIRPEVHTVLVSTPNGVAGVRLVTGEASPMANINQFELGSFNPGLSEAILYDGGQTALEAVYTYGTANPIVWGWDLMNIQKSPSELNEDILDLESRFQSFRDSLQTFEENQIRTMSQYLGVKVVACPLGGSAAVAGTPMYNHYRLSDRHAENPTVVLTTNNNTGQTVEEILMIGTTSTAAQTVAPVVVLKWTRQGWQIAGFTAVLYRNAVSQAVNVKVSAPVFYDGQIPNGVSISWPGSGAARSFALGNFGYWGGGGGLIQVGGSDATTNNLSLNGTILG